MSDSFLRLLARARTGDPAARDRLARLLYPPVRRMLAARFPRQPRDALDDLTQEAMARIVRLLPSCRAHTERRFYAWAYHVARSAALNYLVAPGAVRAASDARLVSLDIPFHHVSNGWAPGTRSGTATPTVLGDALADADALAEILARADTLADGSTDAAADGESGESSGDIRRRDVQAGGGGRIDHRSPSADRAARATQPVDWDTIRDAGDVRLQRLAVRAYRTLPDDAQTLLWLRLVERAEWADLGRDLGITGAAVKRRFERACARLTREFAQRVRHAVNELPGSRGSPPTSAPRARLGSDSPNVRAPAASSSEPICE